MPGHRLFTLSALSPLLLAVAACSDKPLDDPRTATHLVRTATVQTAGADTRSFTGTVSARVQSDLGFRVAGKVLERRVDAGQTVKRGQVLMRIDPVDLKLATLAQEQAVIAARARAQQTAQDEQRLRDLRGTGAISASAYDQAKAAADAAAAQLGAAEAQARTAQNASRYADSGAKPAPTKAQARPAVDKQCSYTVTYKWNADGSVYAPASPLPDCAEFLQASPEAKP